jgi:glycosyltransferase involved in cell wall biosynthesis
MKILFFTNEYSHKKLPDCGGVGTFLKTLAEALTKKGYHVHVFGFSKKKIQFYEGNIHFNFIKKYSKGHFLTELVRSIGAKLNSDALQLFFLKKERKYLANKLKKYALKNKIDVIESFVFSGYTAYFDNSTPLVLRFHGSRGFWHYYLGQKKESLKILMEQKALENASKIVAVSEFSALAIQKMYSIDTHNVIYNGIDTKVFAPNPSIESINQSIFYFGTLSDAKGVHTIAKIFNEVVKLHPKASLHIIGKGNEYWNYLYNNILSNTAKEQTIYYGSKQLNELPELLCKANIICFPTKGENFPFSFLEAMALEKLVIANNIPVTKEIIEHHKNGFIANNETDFIKYISHVFDNLEEAHKIAINARKHIVTHFSKEKMVSETLNLYNELIKISN